MALLHQDTLPQEHQRDDLPILLAGYGRVVQTGEKELLTVYKCVQLVGQGFQMGVQFVPPLFGVSIATEVPHAPQLLHFPRLEEFLPPLVHAEIHAFLSADGGALLLYFGYQLMDSVGEFLIRRRVLRHHLLQPHYIMFAREACFVAQVMQRAVQPNVQVLFDDV